MFRAAQGKRTVLIILALASLFFLDPFDYGYLFAYCLFAYVFLKGNLLKGKISSMAMVLTLFSLIYAFFYFLDPILGLQFVFLYALAPISFFAAGEILYKDMGSKVVSVVFLLGMIFALPNVVAVLLQIYKNGFVSIQRDVPNIWDGVVIPATNFAGPMAMNMCIPAILILKFNFLKNRLFSLLAVVIFLATIASVMRLGSRTQLVICFFTIFIALLYKMSKQKASKNMVLLLILFGVANVVISYISIDMDSDLMSSYSYRMESSKYGAATAGGRTWKWEKSMEYLFTQPFGWSLDEFGLAHNLWFDTARVGGITCFVLLIIFSVSIFKLLIKISKRTEGVHLFTGMAITYCVGFHLLFFVEPIMEGYFSCFVMLCMISGMINQRYEELRLAKTSKKTDLKMAKTPSHPLTT